MKPSEIAAYNEFTAKILLDRLIQLGVGRFFISPGSRSTPLTLTIARSDNMSYEMHYDERGASFAALGYSRAAGKPAALICTSGTAGANYYPAVVEAAMDRIPLLVITADRPPELQGISANQTIEQQILYGTYPRAFLNITPSDSHTDFEQIIKNVDELYCYAERPHPGPVHLNLMFREPLVSGSKQKPLSISLELPPIPKDKPARLSSDELALLHEMCTSDNLLITVGALASSASRKTVKKICDIIPAPVFADIRSALFGNMRPLNTVAYHDQFLLAGELSNKPFNVLHLGGNFTSKRYLTMIENSLVERYVHFDESPYDYNPHFRTTDSVTGSFSSLLRFLSKREWKTKNNRLMAPLTKKSTKVKGELEKFDTMQSLNEISLTRTVSAAIPNNSALFLGSSMPIRDFDSYADFGSRSVTVYANRGASGIDGSIASFAGIMRHHRKGTAVIGDLAALHDLNSLALLSSLNKPAVLVISNNDGGGIFSFLPVSKEKDVFEDCFATPHGLSFEQGVDMFGLPYYKATTIHEFRRLYSQAIKKNYPTVIEFVSERKENHRQYLSLQNEIKRLLKK